MSHSRFLQGDLWPCDNFPNSLFEYFKRVDDGISGSDLIYFEECNEFKNALNSDSNLLEFWTVVQEQHPEKKDYFASLINGEESFDSYWIRREYYDYLKQNAFAELSEEQRRSLQDQYEGMWPAAYRAALEGEALRLNCNISEVRPECDLPPWEANHDEECMLARLPTEMFGRIFQLLDTIDIFRITLVCKRWRSIVYENSSELKRAEHAVTTHIITFTEWMDPQKTPHGDKFMCQYQKFNLSLTRWYCGISENLETLILDHPVHHIYLTNLIQSCPKLKNLQIAHYTNAYNPTNEMIPAPLHLKHLEMFLTSTLHPSAAQSQMLLPRQLHRDILVSSENLRAFRGLLNLEDCFFIAAQKPLSHVFSNLIALDLACFTTAIIEILACSESLDLRYLRLGDYDCSSEVDGFNDKEKTRTALHWLLRRLHRLEVLITSEDATITNATIQLLIDLKLSLSVAVFYHDYFGDESDEDEEIPWIEVDPLQPDVLIAFEDMLLSQNPDVDLSRIVFVLPEGETLDYIESEDTEFGFAYWPHDLGELSDRYDLCVPEIKRLFGIDF